MPGTMPVTRPSSWARDARKDLPVAPCLRGGRIDRHVRGDVGPEHRVQFVDGLLQVGFDLIGQRLGVVAHGLPCAPPVRWVTRTPHFSRKPDQSICRQMTPMLPTVAVAGA